MNADERMKNYHWSECNISEWAKNKITEELNKRGYKIIHLDIFVKICSRMNTLGLVYIISLDTMKDNISYVLTNFTSTHKESEGLEGYPWFIDFFKELEGQALLLFSKNVLDLENKERKSVDVPKVTASIKKEEEFYYTSIINCPVDEFVSFLVDPSLVQMWMKGKVKEKEYILENLIFKITNIEKDKIFIDFKLKKWDKFTNVEVLISDIRGNTKISLRQKNVPIKDIGIMTGIWKDNIFRPICMTFGFCERPYSDE